MPQLQMVLQFRPWQWQWNEKLRDAMKDTKEVEKWEEGAQQGSQLSPSSEWTDVGIIRRNGDFKRCPRGRGEISCLKNNEVKCLADRRIWHLGGVLA